MQVSAGGGSGSAGSNGDARGGQVSDADTQRGQGQGQAGGGTESGGKAGGGGASRVSQQEVDNMISLLEDKGPAILMVHSMGGEIGYEVARQRPELVKGIIAIEPVGSPTDDQEIKDTFRRFHTYAFTEITLNHAIR